MKDNFEDSDWKEIPKNQLENAKESAKLLIKQIEERWYSVDKKYCIERARSQGMEKECFVTTILIQKRMSPEQYMKITGTKKRPPKNKTLVCASMEHHITCTNIFPFENSIRRHIDLKTGMDTLLYIVPKMSDMHLYAPGEMYNNPFIYQGAKYYLNFMADQVNNKAKTDELILKAKRAKEEILCGR